jgi:hypothetical protein
MGRGGAAGAGDRLHAVMPQPAKNAIVKHRRHRIRTTCEMAAVFSTPRLLPGYYPENIAAQASPVLPADTCATDTAYNLRRPLTKLTISITSATTSRM